MTQKQSEVLQALLTTTSKEAAASAAGVNRKTIDKYLQNDDFQQEYIRQRRQLIDNACGDLQRAMAEAVQTLTDIMRNDQNGTQSRIQAARSVLEYGVKLTELTDIAARVEALEEAAKEANA